MTKKITVLIGFPGSGKSHYIKQHFNSEDYTILDDPRSPKDFPDSFDNHLIIADCHLCRPGVLDSFYVFAKKRYPDSQVNLVYFENNPTQCLKNVDYRNDGRLVEPTIKHMTKSYTIPEGIESVPVFDTSTIKNKKKSKPKF